MLLSSAVLASAVLIGPGCGNSDDAALATDAQGGADADPTRPDAGETSGTLSQQYPGDQWDLSNPAFIHTSNFESGETTMTVGSYTGDSFEVVADSSSANSGDRSLKFSFTLTDLEEEGAASVKASAFFTADNPVFYVRYYMRYTDGTARPHHGNGFRMHSPGNDPGGTAGILPSGDERFNARIDLDGEGRNFFYTYWHEMRSGRCNDGSVTPGCDGDQGTTYYYGNRFKPADQAVVDRHQWHCYEYRVQANTPNEYDGELALWVNDAIVGEFKTGTPMGGWLRDNFYTMGEFGTADRQVPFEGFNFRTDEAVTEVRVSFENYQQWNTLSTSRGDTKNQSEEQAVFYDDIVVAKERIGCRVDG